WIREIDVNPLYAAPEGLLALDARVILHGPEMTQDALPRPAIRPYPTQYVGRWTARDGREILIRPIRPEDEPLLVTFHGTLSERSVSFRYFHAMKLSTRVAHDRLTRICFIDYDREMALVAEARNPETRQPELLGVGRLAKRFPANEAEFALLVSDKAQGLGLGTELLSRLIGVGRDEKVDRITAEILPENTEMQRVSRRLGFRLLQSPGEAIVRAELDLT
ncbi:MAG: GNAT family N-acetyltransferase, partial [Isosphaeraceae bacterium]